MTTMGKQKRMEKVRSFSDLHTRAQSDGRYQRLCIVALTNLGCEHLAKQHKSYAPTKWRAHYGGLLDYVNALVGEYGESENTAFREVLAEVNNVRDCIDQAKLEW